MHMLLINSPILIWSLKYASLFPLNISLYLRTAYCIHGIFSMLGHMECKYTCLSGYESSYLHRLNSQNPYATKPVNMFCIIRYINQKIDTAKENSSIVQIQCTQQTDSTPSHMCRHNYFGYHFCFP
jgi:hypothetical protein